MSYCNSRWMLIWDALQEQDQPEDFAKYLRDTSPKIDVDEDGSKPNV